VNPHARRASSFTARAALLALCTSAAACGGEAAHGGSASAASFGSSAPPAVAASAASSRTAQAFYADRFSKKPEPAAMTELGRALFFDPRLSASGKLACATCHDPRFAYGPPNERATQLGGPELKFAGLRAVPSLRYLQSVPPFSEHYYEEGGAEADQGPTGGHTWDGRADTLHDQARVPLLSPLEMANPSLEAVAAKVEQAPYAAHFRAAFGEDVFAEPTRATSAVLLALEVFQQDPHEFYPYQSRYDAYLRGQVSLSAQEARGLSLFNDPQKGNCASCHSSGVKNGAFPAFSDFGFVALGVPRNAALPANRDPGFFDLGLCGPLRSDLSRQREYCGLFRTPTLRNVSVRHVFFRNGVFHRLADVIRFYAERDTNPAEWYGKAGAFDDLPADVRRNVQREPPFGRKPGQAPALNEAERMDLSAFLGTLTDEDLAPAAQR
jgi:cytochrome c peroxidase